MANQAQYPVRSLCRVLKVSPSGFYDWRDRPPSARALSDAVMTERIRSIHADSDATYGMPRVRAELIDHRRFVADGPNQLWVADMTYIPTWAGFLYLAMVLDVWSRKVVGWSMGEEMTSDRVLAALQMAIEQRRPEDVIHHSDQGCTPASPSASAAGSWACAPRWVP